MMINGDSSIPSVDQAWNIKFEDLEFIKEIGSGGFGKVYKGEYLGAPVAIKKVHIAPDDPNRRDLEKFLHREIETIKLFSHPNVIQFVGIASHEQVLYIVTELVEGGDLQYYLKNKSIELPWLLRINVAQDVSLAMSYLHSKNIVHRDLKSTNLLVDVKWKIKVCDFGFARIVDDENNKSMTICGTDNWMSPEMIKGQDYDEKCDVFSFGILLFELIARMKPTPNMRDANFGLNMQVVSQYIPEDVPEPLLELTLNCCDIDSTKRPSFKEITQLLKNMKVQLFGANPSVEYPPLRSFHNVAPIPQIKAIGQQSPPTYGLIADAKKLMSKQSLTIENNFDEEEEDAEQEEEQPQESLEVSNSTLDESNKVDSSDYLSFPRPYSDPEISSTSLTNSNTTSEFVDFSFPKPTFEQQQQQQQQPPPPPPSNEEHHEEEEEEEEEEHHEGEEHHDEVEIVNENHNNSQYNEDDDYDNENEMDGYEDEEDEDTDEDEDISPINSTPMKKNVSFDLSRVSYHTYEKEPNSDDEYEDYEDEDDYEDEYNEEDEEDDYEDDEEDEEYDEENEQILQAQYQRQQAALAQLQSTQVDYEEEYDDVIRHSTDEELEDDQETVQHPVDEDDNQVDETVEVVEEHHTEETPQGEIESNTTTSTTVVEEPVVKVEEDSTKVKPVIETETGPIKAEQESLKVEPESVKPVEPEPIQVVEPEPIQVVEPIQPVQEPIQVVEPEPIQVVEPIQPAQEPIQPIQEPIQPVQEPVQLVDVEDEPVKVVIEEPIKESNSVVQEPIQPQPEPVKVQEPEQPKPTTTTTTVNSSIIASSSPIIESQEPKVESPKKSTSPPHQAVDIQPTPVKVQPQKPQQSTTTTTTTNVKNEKDPLISPKVQRNCCNCWVM